MIRAYNAFKQDKVKSDLSIDLVAMNTFQVIDWDGPGVLSIVIQGAVFRNGLVEAATHSQHWRQLFPNAEIIFVVSVSDIIEGTLEDGVYTSIQLVKNYRHDGTLVGALSILQQNCTKVALAGPALPLPPIKRDSPKLNNMNFQITAAKCGLALTTGQYVLRVRSDLIFLDRSFLTQYSKDAVLPRGKAANFRQRVMISWLYTLNPFTVERMPLHFSDWFHFGLTEDVRKIWAIPFVTLRDSIYYKTQPHDPDSNAAERLFDTRLAVEQHVMLHCFKPDFPSLTLDFHNDRSSISLAMDLLIDNFILCDLVRAHCVFDKYSHEFKDPSKRVHCITPDSWRAMAQSRVMPYKDMLSTEATQVEAEFSDPQSFPIFFEARHFKTRIGEVANGRIVARAKDGVLFYGPYARLRLGSYVATVQGVQLEGRGTVTLVITTNGGENLLAQRSFSLRGRTLPELELPFRVTLPFVSDLEIVCTLKSVTSMTVTGVSISEGQMPEIGTSRLGALRSILRT